jgi:hypothetical protein
VAGSATKGGNSQQDHVAPGTVVAKNGQRKYGSPAVDRALDILEFMSTHPRPYGATELSRFLGIPKNTVFRILRSLAEKEYAAQDPVTGEFTLSTRVFTLGMSLYTRFELRQREHGHIWNGSEGGQRQPARFRFRTGRKYSCWTPLEMELMMASTSNCIHPWTLSS